MCDFCRGSYRRHSRVLRPGPAAPGTAARSSGPPLPSAPSRPSGPSGAFTPVVPGVLLCWRAPSPPRIRYKILPAWCCANQSGTKLSLHAERAPNRAISGEQGEFCTGYVARVGVLGEFCTGGARCGCSWASCVVLLRSPCASWRAMAAPCRRPRAPRPGPPCSPVPSIPVGLGR